MKYKVNNVMWDEIVDGAWAGPVAPQARATAAGAAVPLEKRVPLLTRASDIFLHTLRLNRDI